MTPIEVDDLDLEEDAVLPDDADDVDAELLRDDVEDGEDEDKLDRVLLDGLEDDVDIV